MSYYVKDEPGDCSKCGASQEDEQMYICPDCENLVCWECYESGGQECEECTTQLEDLDTFIEEEEELEEIEREQMSSEHTELFAYEEEEE